MNVTVNRARRIAQTKTKAFKSNIIPVGETLAIMSYEKHDAISGKTTRPADYLLCTHVEAGKTIKLPLSEFNQMTAKEGDDLVRRLEGDNEQFPQSVTIVATEDRLDRENNPYYPAYAYNDADEFYESLSTDNQMSWEDLVASKVKEGNTTDPIQNYTVSCKF